MNKQMYSMSSLISTLGPVGYLPAPGTCATVLTTGILWSFSGDQQLSYVVCCISIVASVLILRTLDVSSCTLSDRPSIVLDEVVGTLVVFMGVFMTPLAMITGILLFRFFDIVKPLGVWRCELLPGAWGIVADDVAAGLVSNLVLRICISISLVA